MNELAMNIEYAKLCCTQNAPSNMRNPGVDQSGTYSQDLVVEITQRVSWYAFHSDLFKKLYSPTFCNGKQQSGKLLLKNHPQKYLHALSKILLFFMWSVYSVQVKYFFGGEFRPSPRPSGRYDHCRLAVTHS